MNKECQTCTTWPKRAHNHKEMCFQQGRDCDFCKHKGAADDLPYDSIPKDDGMLRWFEYQHLPPHLQAASRPFCELARHIVDNVPDGRERAVALRKLLESKDAAVRAVIEGA